MLKNKFNFLKAEKYIFFIAVLLLTFALGLSINYLDHDLFSRLIAGYSVYNFGHVFYNDVISYTPTHVWYDHEWITSTFLYYIVQKFDASGINVLKCLSAFLVIFLINIAIKQRISKSNLPLYNIEFYGLILMVFANASILKFVFRCQSVTFILLALWIYVLEKIRSGSDKLLYLLPFIMLFWLNSHGGSIAGVGILILYGIGELLNKKPFKKYFIVLIPVCLVYLINPWGLDFINFMMQTPLIDRSLIREWMSPFTMNDPPLSISYFIFLSVASVSYITAQFINKVKYSTFDKTKFLLLIVTAYLSMTAVKHITLFIITASIFVYEDFAIIFNKLGSKISSLFDDSKYVRYTLFAKNILIYLAIFIYSIPAIINNPPSTSYYHTIQANYPIGAVEFMRINDIKGKMLCPFHYASYIAWQLYPNIKIYMDGRQEQVYDREIYDALMDYADDTGANPQRLMEKYEPDIFIGTPYSDLSYKLDNSKWVKIYDDGYSNIVVKRSMLKDNYKPVTKYAGVLYREMFKNSYFFKKS